jgi:hypothetical protein
MQFGGGFEGLSSIADHNLE